MPSIAPSHRADGRPLAAALNRACRCFPVSREQIVSALRDDPLREEHHALVSGAALFVAASDAEAISAFIANAGRAMALPAFRQAALAQSGASAQHDPGIAGGLLGYDFHLSDDGPKLIEINTNPGGVLINAEIQDALQACCQQAEDWLPRLPGAAEVRDAVFAVFEREWQQAGGRGAPTVAIVDDQPEGQYLSPEFVLFRKLFAERGWAAHITDPSALTHRDNALWLGEARIDLVYNRLTDFALTEPASAALRSAWQAGQLALTPHPRAHALHADKRLLAWLSDESRLRELGVGAATAKSIAARLPPTFEVRREDGERWWQERKDYYFKPAAGYGSKAAYAGDKLTRKTFEQVLGGGYLAQQRVLPPQRDIGGQQSLKYDLRAYVDPADHRVILMTARLYRGQTTNFRTPGGGFAPVVVVRPERLPRKSQAA